MMNNMKIKPQNSLNVNSKSQDGVGLKHQSINDALNNMISLLYNKHKIEDEKPDPEPHLIDTLPKKEEVVPQIEYRCETESDVMSDNESSSSDSADDGNDTKKRYKQTKKS